MDESTITVSALMTAPRYECVYARSKIEKALHDAGIPLSISGGVYYGQCMQIMLEKLSREPVQYALTVDFDSIFTTAQVQRLLSIIAYEEHIDAIAAVQPKRGVGELMASNGKEEQLIWDGNPIRVRSAHFGLTVIDMEKLVRVPKPWFHAAPNADGEWGDGKLDDDVSFWNAWDAAGNSLYIDPGTRLGHMEEMVSVFDERMQLQHMYPNQWEELNECAVS